jgi:hypothetical protein
MITRPEPVPHRDFLLKYINAFNLSASDAEKWFAENNNDFSKAQLLALVNGGIRILDISHEKNEAKKEEMRKLKQNLLTKIENLDREKKRTAFRS